MNDVPKPSFSRTCAKAAQVVEFEPWHGKIRALAMCTHFVSIASGILCLLAPSFASAVTPLSPRLTTESRAELLSMLSRADFPEDVQNSVLIALTGVLGLKAQQKTYTYKEPYPQLPVIEARSTPNKDDCAVVSLHARYLHPKPGSIRLKGTYCLSDVGEWRANKQAVTRGK